MADYRTTFFPFSRWRPDGGDIANNDLLTLNNVVPYGGTFIPVYPRIKKTTAIDGVCYGIGVNMFASNDAGWMLYYGNDRDLYEVDPDDWSMTDVSGASYDISGSEYGWQFSAFGKHQIACCGNGTAVQYRANGSGNFANMITSTEKPRFKFIGPLGGISQGLQLIGFCVGSNGVTVGSGDDVFWTSDVDDIQTFQDGGILSDWIQYSDDYGPWTGAAFNTDFGALAFKKRAIYLIDNTGLNGLEVRRIITGEGTIYPNSIHMKGRKVYFWTTDGQPAYWEGGDHIVKIAEGSFARSIMDPAWVDPDIDSIIQNDNGVSYRLHGVYDPVVGTHLWSYRSNDVATESDNCDILLNTTEEEGVVYPSVSSVKSATLVGLGETSASSKISAMVSVPDLQGTFSSSATVVYVAESGNSDYFYIADVFGNESYDEDPRFGSGFLVNPDSRRGDKHKAWKIIGVKPIVSMGDTTVGRPSITVTITSKDRPWHFQAADVFTSTYTANASDDSIIDREGYLNVNDTSGKSMKFLQKISIQFGVTINDSFGTVPPQMFYQFAGLSIKYVTGGELG